MDVLEHLLHAGGVHLHVAHHAHHASTSKPDPPLWKPSNVYTKGCIFLGKEVHEMRRRERGNTPGGITKKARGSSRHHVTKPFTQPDAPECTIDSFVLF